MEAFMKRIVFLTVIAFLAIGTISAQGWGYRWTPPQTVTVEGTLQLQNGQIVLSSGTNVYFVPTLARYIGFIDGLREGARVSVEGYASGNFLEINKLTISGKAYDFSANTNVLAASYGCYGYGGGYGCGGYGVASGSSRRGRW